MEIAKYIKENFLGLLLLILLGVLIMMNLMKDDKYIPPADVYTSEFCVEWELGITRERLVYECYNFKDSKILCDWVINDLDELFIYDYKNGSVIAQFHCIRYAKTRTQEPPVIQSAPSIPPYSLPVIEEDSESFIDVNINNLSDAEVAA